MGESYPEEYRVVLTTRFSIGPCNYLLYNLGMIEDPSGVSGAVHQAIEHIIEQGYTHNA